MKIKLPNGRRVISRLPRKAEELEEVAERLKALFDKDPTSHQAIYALVRSLEEVFGSGDYSFEDVFVSVCVWLYIWTREAVKENRKSKGN